MDNQKYLWGISQKEDGQMKVSPGDIVSQENRIKFFGKLQLDPNRVVSAGLVHGDNVAVVGEENFGQKIVNVDGLITSAPNVILTISIADCLPLYFFDNVNQVLGLAHAGWRGVSQEIAIKMLDKMMSEFGTRPEDVCVEIGPHIKDCHFEVDEDVAQQFSDYQEQISKKGEKSLINLSGIVREQLRKRGVKEENINISEECTYCLKEKYYSFRRDKPTQVEAMVAYVLKRG